MIVSLIAALASNGTIGRAGNLPWRLPADLARFRRLTWGHPLIMGRITYESIGRPLPGRTTIVISRQTDYPLAGSILVQSLDAALAAAAATGSDEVFICGGGQLYRDLLPRANRLYLTIVHEQTPGDTRFPPISEEEFTLVAEEPSPDVIPCTFRRYERRQQPVP
jgi:dihydrofolate reductase